MATLPPALAQRLHAATLGGTATIDIQHRLEGGRTNASFLVECDGMPGVLRFDTPAAQLPGVDRAREARIQALAAAADLAPAVIARDHALGITLFEYLPGPTLCQLAERVDPAAVAAMMRRVHALPATGPAFDYLGHLGALGVDVQAPDIEAALAELQAQEDVCTVHHDPTPANVLKTAGGLKLIDWEYAANGYAALDWAALVEARLVTATTIVDRDICAGTLAAAQVLYRAMCSAWETHRWSG